MIIWESLDGDKWMFILHIHFIELSDFFKISPKNRKSANQRKLKFALFQATLRLLLILLLCGKMNHIRRFFHVIIGFGKFFHERARFDILRLVDELPLRQNERIEKRIEKKRIFGKSFFPPDTQESFSSWARE